MCPSSSPNVNLINSSWGRQVDTHPNRWLRGASPWFVQGQDPLKLSVPPSGIMMSKMEVRIPNTIKCLEVRGRFKVELVEAGTQSSLTLYGPYSELQAVAVKVTPQGLSISEDTKASSNMGRVVIRLVIPHLYKLTQKGSGAIEGYLTGHDPLCIVSTGCGSIYLAGPVNLRQVMNQDGGNVTVLGAMTPDLTIEADRSGNVNVSGRIGVRSIIHHGAGEVNIIGASTGYLTIDADGQGKIGLAGPRIAVNRISAKDSVRVYAYHVSGQSTNVSAMQDASVGLAGNVHTLYVETDHRADFEGRFLFSDNAFLRSQGSSHINASVRKQLFASSTNESSIYYFGNPSIVSKSAKQRSVILGIPSYKDYREQVKI
jgi:hypothetical protein